MLLNWCKKYFFFIFYCFISINNVFASDDKVSITTTNSILADIAKHIGKDNVIVNSIIGKGQELHEYSPKPSDLKKFFSSNLFIYNGLNTEGWLESIDIPETVSTMAASDNCEFIINTNGQKDVHVWNSPKGALCYVNNIKNKLISLNPEKKDYYEQNAKEMIDELIELSNRFHTQFNNLEKAKLLAIVSHDAFVYLAQEFGIILKPIKNSNEDRELSVFELKSIIQDAKKLSIKIIFTEKGENSKLAETVANNIDGIVIDGLYADYLSNSSEADSYIKYLEYNLETIYNAFEKK